jgi:predicted PurR-regulated permease PerM
MPKDRTSLLLYIAIGSTAALALILAGFWKPIFWAVVLGILFRPVMDWFETRVPGRRTLGAALSVLGILLALLIPALLLGSVMVTQGLAIYARIQSGALTTDGVSRWINRLYDTGVGRWLSGIGLDLASVTLKLQTGLLEASTFVMSLAANVGQNAAGVLIGLVMMLYLLFFVLRDGPEIEQSIFLALPMPNDQKQRFFVKFAETATATLVGGFVVGLAQGTLGGLIFAVLGINGAVFWGVVMALLSLIPAIGSAIIWFPTALILMLGGSWGKGLVLLGFGMLVISLVDNLLRPIVVGRKAHLPDYVVLFSTVGGLATMGITGFVAGPVVAALFIVAWQLTSEEQP